MQSRGACSASTQVLVAGLALNLLTRGVIGAFETLTTQLAPQFGISATDAGMIVSLCGTVGVVQLLYFKALYASRWSDSNLILAGLTVMAAGCAAMIRLAPEAGNTSPWKLIAAIFCVYAFGYPIGNTAALGLFSKAAGSAPQGLLLGIFGMAGSGARVVFPIVSGAVAEYYGQNALFSGLTVVSLSSMIVVLLIGRAIKELGI